MQNTKAISAISKGMATDGIKIVRRLEPVSLAVNAHIQLSIKQIVVGIKTLTSTFFNPARLMNFMAVIYITPWHVFLVVRITTEVVTSC